MLRKPKGFDEAKSFGSSTKLPVGVYQCEIKKAEAIKAPWDSSIDQLVISFDISEGEYKDYYLNKWNNDKDQPERKWKGHITYTMPSDDGSDKDKTLNSILKGLMEALEDSNSGYHWDWDESKIKGLKCGMIFRERFYSFNGRNGTFTEPYKIVAIDKMKTAKIPDLYVPNKLLSEYNAYIGNGSTANSDDFMNVPDGVSDLPF